MIKKPPGIEDIFPDRIDTWNFITSTAREVFRLYNYREIIIPIFEYTDVFARGIGDETDIVSKEMFTFEDRGGRSLTLRPEGTASVVRAYVENGEYNRLATCKLFYAGPMFRAERPQRGRLRQFNQFGAEFFGSDAPFYDYESIAIMDTISQRLGLKDYRLLINSIGCPECRPGYIQVLTEYFQSHENTLCNDCKTRLHKNPLRILDCKQESCTKLRDGAPEITSHHCENCSTHYSQLKNFINSNNISYTEDPYLVRGLDYYTRTTFEFVTDKLGGQNAFAAGGRYDNLVSTFEGKETPAVGFAAGIERIALLLETAAIPGTPLDSFLIHTGEEALTQAYKTAALLRSNNISVEMEPVTKSFKAQFKKADREGASLALIIGEDEIKAGTLSIKELQSGEQYTVKYDELISKIREALGR